MFVHARLTRGQGVDPRTLTYAVLDFETTGLHPGQGSRVCEIGVVRMRGDGTVIDEFSTLIDPRLRITNEEHHGVTNADVKGAPTFDLVAGDLLNLMSNAVVVSHNLDYESKFAAAEFGRPGMGRQGIPGICTLVASRTHLDRWGYRLDNVANLLTGEWPIAQHSALGDARTLAWTFSTLINEAPQQLLYDGPAPVELGRYPCSRHVAPRATGLRKGSDGWLSALTARLPLMAEPPAPMSNTVGDYRAMLGHALADGKIVGEEAGQLAVLAARAGLTQTTAWSIHDEFLADARAKAEADGIVTSSELKELQRAAKELAASHLIKDLEEAAAVDRSRKNGPLRGWRVLPVGDDRAVTDLMDFAAFHGAAIAVNVTKTVRLVIASDTREDDPRLVKARSAGIDVVTPDRAKTLLEAEISSASQGLFADPEGEAVSKQLAAERAAAAERARPEWHEYWREHELSPAEYRAQFVERRDDWDADWDDDQHRRTRTVTVTVDAQQTRKGGCGAAALAFVAAGTGLAEAVRHLVAAVT